MNEYDSNRILDFTKKINYISTQNILKQIVTFLIHVT